MYKVFIKKIIWEDSISPEVTSKIIYTIIFIGALTDVDSRHD